MEIFILISLFLAEDILIFVSYRLGFDKYGSLESSTPKWQLKKSVNAQILKSKACMIGRMSVTLSFLKALLFKTFALTHFLTVQESVMKNS